MNILFLTQYYPPETGACANRISGFARYLASQQHTVTVLTGFPHYPLQQLYPGYKVSWCQPDTDGLVRLLRCWLLTLPASSPWHRLLTYLGFFVSALWAGCFRAGPQEVVVATSGPIFVGVAGALLAWIKGVPFVLDVRDLWPERVVVAGELRNRLLIWLLERLETFMYWRAAQLVCVTDGLRQKLRQKGIAERHLEMIPNGTDPDLYQAAAPAPDAFVPFGVPAGRFVIVYAGTLGLLQDHDLFLRTAEAIQASPDMYLVLIGEGVKRPLLQQEASKRHLTRLRLVPNMPRDQLATLLPSAQLGINANTAVEHNIMAIPVKMFDYMACGLPVVVANAGEVRAIVEDAQAGVCTPPGDVAGFVQALRRLYEHPGQRAEMGARGRRLLLERYATRVLARRFETLLVQQKHKA